MRIPATVMAASLSLASPALAENAAATAEVHCEPDTARSSQDMAQLERNCLMLLEGLASRAGDLLHLTLADGAIKTFVDDREACEQGDADKCVRYRLAAYYPGPQLFVIQVAAYESYKVMVVNRRGAAMTIMDAYPHMAPGGKRLVSVAASEAWELDNDIAIYFVAADGLTREWAYKAQEYEMWEFIGWDGDDRIRLEVTLRPISNPKAFATFAAEARHTGSGWRLFKNVRR